MQPADVVTIINRLFSESDAAILVAALRQDELVWNAVQDEAISNRLGQESKPTLESWSPAALFCLSESLPVPADLKNLSLGLDGNIRQLAIQNYEKISRDGIIPTNLQQAGYAALALRERRKLVKSWENLADEIVQDNLKTERDILSHWQAVLAILAGIIPDEEIMFGEILGLRGKIGRELVSHAILSSPTTVKDKVNLLSSLMISLDLSTQIDWLQSFALRGEIKLSEQLAKLLISNSTTSILNGFLSTELSALDLPQVAAKAVRLQQAATLFQLAGKDVEANRYLNSAADTLSYLNSGIRLQQAGIQTVIPTSGTSSSTNNEDVENDGFTGLEGELLLAAATGSNKSSAKGMPGKFGRSFQDLREAARMAAAGEKERARDLAGPAVDAFMRFISRTGTDYSPKFLINWQPEEFIDLLITMNYLKEAGIAAEWFLRFQPTNARLLGLAGDLFSRDAQPERAAKSLSLAVSLNPKGSENRRLLAKLHETNGQYSNAVSEWKRVVELSENPMVDDQMNMAIASFKAEKFNETYEICKSIVDNDPFNGIAACYLGQAAAAIGDEETASENLQKTILLAPDFTEGWLALSRFQKQKGDLQKAYETLRSASFSLPDSSEINLELALLSMETGRPSEALPHLRLAASLQPENLEVASMLTNALITLGHKDEAVDLLTSIRKHWPEEAGLARTHGFLLQEAGKFRDAIDPLKVVVRKDSSDEDAVINLCLSQLETKLDSFVVEGKSKPNINLAETAQIISTLLTKNPESVRGHLILGALQYAMGNLDEAFDEFKSAADLASNKEVDTRWIAQGGLGRTALALNRPEIALAVLDEASAENPKNLALQRMLVPAYLKANLPQEALITARHAMEMAPDEVDNLVWYAQTMLAVGNREESTKTIRKASDGLNGNAASLINLASLGLELGEQPVARKALMELGTLPSVDSDDLARAANIQIMLGDTSSASENLTRAIKQSNPINSQWLFELSGLQKSMGDSTAAQESIKQAVSIDPLSTENWLLQADLFEEQGRHQSSLESLEKALTLINDKKANNPKEESNGFIPLFEKYRNTTAADIHARFSHLMYQIGNLTGALVHSEQSLELEPQNINFRLQAARLAESLLLSDRALSLAEIPPEQSKVLDLEENGSQECDDAAELLLIKATRLISAQKYEEAEAVYQEIRRLSPSGFVKENIEIQLAAANGNINDVKDVIDSHVVQHLLNNKKSKPALLLSGISIAALEAAMAAERWDLALKLAGQIASNHPLEPAAHLAYARTIVRSGEEYLLRKELGITRHLPSVQVMEPAQHDKFEIEILAAGKQSNSSEVTRWQKRGLILFGGKSSLDKVSVSDFPESDDQAAYLQSLRNASRMDEVIAIGEKVEESGRVLMQMALAYADQNPRVGLDLCQHIVETNKPSPVYFAASAKLAELSGETGLAIDFLNEALQQYADEPGWRAWLSNLLAAQKDYDNAAYHMEEALSMEPDSSANWEALGNLYIQNKQNTQAIHAFGKAVEINPQNPDSLLALASSYRSAGEIQDALDCIEKAVELNVRPEKALLLRGEISRDLGNLIDSIEFSKKALKANPQSKDAYLFLAQTQRIAGKANEAIATIEQAISTLGSNIEFLIEKAKILHSFRGAKEVLPFLQGLSSQYPRNGEILSMLARVQAEMGDLQNAEHTALESLKIQPRQPDLNLFVGKILRKSGQLDKAIHHFGQAVEQSHMDLEAVIELAQTHQDQREFEKALEAFKLAIQIAPRDVRAYTGAAGIYRESKDYSLAEDMLRRAAEIDPSNLAIRRQLGAVVALNLVHTSQEAKTLA